MSSDFVITPLSDGRFLVTSPDGRQQLAWAVADPAGAWVFVDGRPYYVPTQRDVVRTASSPAAGGEAEAAALSAPMPARVLSVRVAPGQDVAAGDVLVMLEAMKMELPVEAPRDGKVKTIACREGELVQPGVPLVELE